MVNKKENVIFILAFIFFLLSLTNLLIIFQATVATGRTTQGSVQLCIHHIPTIDVSNQEINEGSLFTLYVNYTNQDGRTIVFEDDASFFTIHQDGLINFTPNGSEIGIHYVNISVRETDGFCLNSTAWQNVTFIISSVTKNDTLDAWSDTDAKGGSLTRYANENVAFFANYTNNSTGAAISGTGVFCELSVNETGTYSSPVNMTFNSTSGLYSQTYKFNDSGNYWWKVLCNASQFSAYYGGRNVTKNITITNRPPVLMTAFPNETWNMAWNIQSFYVSQVLDDYFKDPEGKNLTYNSTNVNNIEVRIDSVTHRVTFVADANFYGNRTVLFFAKDPHNATAESNLVYLEVKFTIQPTPTPTPGPSPSGGGGGGVGPITPVTVLCDEMWECDAWGNCLPSGIMTRSCTDLAECGTTTVKPNESMSCVYKGTCDDHIKNCHDGSCELGVDCGGPCPACPTCQDGAMNQDETDTDCGGMFCPRCVDGLKCTQSTDCLSGYCYRGVCRTPSCFDGIKNQGELGVDCGGPCKKCSLLEMPGMIGINAIPVIILILLLLIVAARLTYRLKHYVHPVIASVLVKLMQLFAIVRKKTLVSFETSLRMSTLMKLRELDAKVSSVATDKIFKEFAAVMKSFVRSLLHTQYQFTYEEISRFIEKQKFSGVFKVILLTFLKKMSDIEYSGKPLKPDELHSLIHEAIVLVELTTEQPLVKQAKEKAALNSVSQIEKLLVVGNKYVDKSKPGEASVVYQKISEIYERMPDEDKKKLHKRIIELYNRIVAAAEKKGR